MDKICARWWKQDGHCGKIVYCFFQRRFHHFWEGRGEQYWGVGVG